jgi:hypothetical protein
MKNHVYPFLLLIVTLFSCSSKKLTTQYYYQNKDMLAKIEGSYSKLYKEKAFKIAFTDKYFQTISLEIITDTLTYVYEFGLGENRIKDSLYRYGLDTLQTMELIRNMRSIRCTWVNNFNYYVDEKKRSLIFISIKPVELKNLFSNKKYYVLTYFSQPQYFDKEGRLMANRRRRQMQKVNGEIFRRINDKVSYTISTNYR